MCISFRECFIFIDIEYEIKHKAAFIFILILSEVFILPIMM
jgi:hypothetical protein